MADSLELFNSHQEDVRRRADSLAKAIFILAGGTLTVSIGIFTGSSAPELTAELSCALKASWWALIFAIIFLVMALTIIIRDYFIGERWRKQLGGHEVDVSGKSTTRVEIMIWIFSIFGILAFIGGLLGQAYVASSVIKAQSIIQKGALKHVPL